MIISNNIMLHIYYGMGKGKSSTLNGSAIRAKGSGMNVCLFRFLKGRKTHEDQLIKKMGIPVYKSQTSEKFVIQMNNNEKKQTKKELNECIKILKNIFIDFDLIILDEFLDLLENNVGLIDESEMKEILNLLKEKEVMVSGHSKHKNIFEMADLITYYKPEKHYFDKGVKARKGIEF